jgi:single-strand DNA-binding protein
MSHKEQGSRTDKKSLPSINRVTLLGNLGRDPDVYTTKDGRKIAALSLATTQGWTNKQGEWQERTDWHRVVIFDESLANRAEKALGKGSRVYVEGSLQTRKWTDQAGTERSQTEVVLLPTKGEMIIWEAKKNAPKPEGKEPAQNAPHSQADPTL